MSFGKLGKEEDHFVKNSCFNFVKFGVLVGMRNLLGALEVLHDTFIHVFFLQSFLSEGKPLNRLGFHFFLHLVEVASLGYDILESAPVGLFFLFFFFFFSCGDS